MNELKGKFLNIVLSVDEGRGFDLLKCPFYITANFNGRIMESDIVEAHPNVVFNTEMVWETEKKLLRKARGSYARVRLECFTTERKFVGFALLCLRSAKIIASNGKNMEVQYVWNKLLNVPNEFKKAMPELSVSLTIRDFLTTKAVPPPNPILTGATSLPKLPALQVDHVRVPVKYTEKGYIQLGADSDDLETYQLKLTILVASNLDVLLPEELVFSEAPKQFYLVFEVFGMDVRTRQLTRDLHENITFNETVVINLQSNFKLLGIYFSHFSKINVKFFNDDMLLARTQIDMTGMGWNVDPAVFYNWCQGKLEMAEDCFFESEGLKNPTASARRASLSTFCTMQLLKHPPVGVPEKGECSTSVTPSAGPEGEPLVGALRTVATSNRKCLLKRIDEISEPSFVSLVDNRTPTNSDVTSASVTNASISATTSVTQTSTSPSATMTSATVTSAVTADFKEDNIYDTHQQFCLDIILDAIFWKAPPTTTSFLLKFLHPKVMTHLQLVVDIESDLHKRILLQNAVCKLMFTSTRNRLGCLLANSCPKMELRNAETNELIGEALKLNSAKVNYDKPESSYIITLKSHNGRDLADINVSLFLEEFEMSYECISPYDLMPHILDDSLVMQNIQELEDWKQQKRKQFEDDLYDARKNEINKLYGDWTNRKARLESALMENIDRCKKLSFDLKKSSQNFQLDKVIRDRRYSDDEYNIYLEIHKNTIRYSLSDNHELVEKISELEIDVAVLRDLLTEQSVELKEMKKTQLTSEQTKTLLKDLRTMEEKYEIAVKDKNYFKCEYEKAVQEVHKLKVEDHKKVTSKIAHDKEQLSQYTLETFAACITSIIGEGLCGEELDFNEDNDVEDCDEDDESNGGGSADEGADLGIGDDVDDVIDDDGAGGDDSLQFRDDCINSQLCAHYLDEEEGDTDHYAEDVPEDEGAAGDYDSN